jgi:hypothetical protein
MNDVTHAGAAAMTPAKGLLVLAGVVVVVGAFIGLNHVLGIKEFWAGFLFLLYWTGFEHMKFDKLPSCIVGALFGLLLAYLLFALPGWMGPTGGLVFLGLILVVIYCQIMGWLTLAINMCAMLFLTVGTIPVVQAGVNFANAFIALGLGIVFFGGLFWIGNLLKQRKASPSVAS